MAKGRGSRRQQRGRGIVPVEARSRPRVGVHRDAGTVSLSFDLEVLPQPTSLFVADFTDVRATPDAVGLIFGKTRPYGGGLAHIVEVSITRRSFDEVMWPTVKGVFLENLRAVCERLFSGWSPPEMTGTEDAEYVPVQANLARLSYAGEDAAVDFFLFSAHDMSLVLRGLGNDLDITAVLRVMLSTPRLLSLLDRCEDMLALGEGEQ